MLPRPVSYTHLDVYKRQSYIRKQTDKKDADYGGSYFQTNPMIPKQHTESFIQYFFWIYHNAEKPLVHRLDLPLKHQTNL